MEVYGGKRYVYIILGGGEEESFLASSSDLKRGGGDRDGGVIWITGTTVGYLGLLLMVVLRSSALLTQLCTDYELRSCWWGYDGFMMGKGGAAFCPEHWER